MDKEVALLSFEEFKQDWLRRHPHSVPPKVRVSSAELVSSIVLWSIIAIGAALVSGAHSIPAILTTIPATVTTPLREILSLAGFTILEMLIFAGSLYRRVSRFALAGLIVSMVGALAANVGSSVEAVRDSDPLTLATSIILAITAPLAAFLAGEMIHLQVEKHKAIVDSANTERQSKLRKLDTTIDTAYRNYLDEQTDKQTTRAASTSVQTADRQTVKSAFGYNRTSDGQQRVVDYLNMHPEHAALSLRVLADMIGVNKDTVNAGRKAWQEQFGASSIDAIETSINGNGHYQE